MYIASTNSAELPMPVLVVSGVMIGIALMCVMIRFVRGPEHPDRIVAVDLLASLVMAAILLSGLATNNRYDLQVVLGFAVILFLGTLALARYLDPPQT